MVPDTIALQQRTLEEIGHRLSAAALVRFRLPAGVMPHAIAAATGESVDVERDAATIRTTDPQPVLYRLLTWAEREHLVLGGLEVSRPTLEDIFLRYYVADHPGDDAPATPDSQLAGAADARR